MPTALTALPALPALRALAAALALAAGGAWADDAPAAAIDGERFAELRLQAVAYEHGEGVAKDSARAVELYCEAARQGDSDAQYGLGWMYANGRGVKRDDALAAYFFNEAGERGHRAAIQMLNRISTPPASMPACMRDPDLPAPPVSVVEAAPAERPTWPNAPAVIQSAAPKPLLELVKKIAPKFMVHPQLALTIMQAESGFNPTALSPKNAMGLMQLIPETSARFNVKQPYDPAQNIRGGVAYLSWLLAYFEGDVALVAAAYNAGEGTVDKYLGVPPYPETQAYVQRVLKGVGIKSYPFDASVTAASRQLGLIRQQNHRRTRN